MTDAAGALRLLHADARLIVVDKPAGLLAVPGRGDDKQDALSTRVQARWPDARVVHRLDQPTSGLMVFARGLAAQRQLGAAFMRRAVRKRYVAIVDGRLAPACGAIALPLRPDWPQRPRQCVDLRDGKPSLTYWQVLGNAPDQQGTRVELRPLSGRTHQLRVHLQAIGHAIVGDALYAPPPVQARSRRLLLHAAELAFAHPDTGEPLRFDAPVPF